jgi:hypothetical protein
VFALAENNTLTAWNKETSAVDKVEVKAVVGRELNVIENAVWVPVAIGFFRFSSSTLEQLESIETGVLPHCVRFCKGHLWIVGPRTVTIWDTVNSHTILRVKKQSRATVRIIKN